MARLVATMGFQALKINLWGQSWSQSVSGFTTICFRGEPAMTMHALPISFFTEVTPPAFHRGNPFTCWPLKFLCFSSFYIFQKENSMIGRIALVSYQKNELREAVNSEKKDFLWNHFIKWWPPPSPFYEVPIYFFSVHFLSEKKRWFWRLFEGCWWVF